MRILGGSLAGTILKPNMKSWPTRPTTDMAKEALYNILMNRIDFTQVAMLDLFGGTGIHSLEFLSRGCKQVVYIDKYGPCVKWIKSKVSEFNLQEYIQIYQKDVLKYLKAPKGQFDIIFADPPYSMQGLEKLPDMIFDAHLLSESGMLIIEHDRQHQFDDHVKFESERKYGQTRFSFFSSI